MRRAPRVDPRSVTSFGDLQISRNILSKLPPSFKEPLGIQRKILSLASSNLSCIAQSVPGLGKSTAAILSMMERPQVAANKITNLVVVPRQGLADQYVQSMNQLVPGSVKSLYRTGSVDGDEAQYTSLTQNPFPHTLVATPSRLLDYLCYTDIGTRLSNLSQVVVDELDAYPTKTGKTTLEILTEHLLRTQRPSLLLLYSPGRPLSFESLPNFLENWQDIYDVRQHEPPSDDVKVAVWTGEGQLSRESSIAADYKREKSYARALQQCWNGAGIVVLPNDASISKFYEVNGESALAVKSEDLAGINLPDLDRLYVLGIEESTNLVRLKWTLRSAPKELIIHLVDSDPMLASEKLKTI